MRTTLKLVLPLSLSVALVSALFAWHHHPLPLSTRGAPTIAAPAGPSTPVLADDDCQICFALGHHGAVPVDFFAPSTPDQARLHQPRLLSVDAPLAPYFSFQSRAPPVA